MACEELGQERLTGADLYVTLEPCTMCAAAISSPVFAGSTTVRRTRRAGPSTTAYASYASRHATTRRTCTPVCSERTCGRYPAEGSSRRNEMCHDVARRRMSFSWSPSPIYAYQRMAPDSGSMPTHGLFGKCELVGAAVLAFALIPILALAAMLLCIKREIDPSALGLAGGIFLACQIRYTSCWLTGGQSKAGPMAPLETSTEGGSTTACRNRQSAASFFRFFCFFSSGSPRSSSFVGVIDLTILGRRIGDVAALIDIGTLLEWRGLRDRPWSGLRSCVGRPRPGCLRAASGSPRCRCFRQLP